MAITKKNLSYGMGAPLINVFPAPKVSKRAPTVRDKYNIGQVWIDVPNDDVYTLSSIRNNLASWIGTGGGAGAFTTLTATTTIAAGTSITAGTTIAAGSTIAAGTGITAGTALTLTIGNFTIGDFVTAGILSNTAAGVIESSAGTDGQLIIGATGAAPAWATLASADGSVTIVAGANTLDLSASGVNMTINSDSTAATEAANAFTIAGTANEIVTVGAGSTITVGFVASPTIAGALLIGTGATITSGGLTIDAGGALISAGNLDITLGNATVAAGDFEVTLGTVTAGNGLIATAGGADITGDSGIIGDLDLYNDAVDATGVEFGLKKDRAGATIVTADSLGEVNFSGFEGTSYISGAAITADSSGTIATNRVAGTLNFWTHPDGVAADPTKRMYIKPTGEVEIVAPDSGYGLGVLGGGIAVVGDIESDNDEDATTAAYIDLVKTRLSGAITTGDELGVIRFYGDEGTSQIAGALIKSISIGTIATDRVAADLEFWTHRDTTDTAIQRMVIDHDGAVVINAPSAGVGLTIAGGALAVTGGISEATEDVTISTATKGLILPGGLKVISGTGTPNASVTAPKGSLYLRSDGSGANDRAYINTDSSTAWTNLVTAA